VKLTVLNNFAFVFLFSVSQYLFGLVLGITLSDFSLALVLVSFTLLFTTTVDTWYSSDWERGLWLYVCAGLRRWWLRTRRTSNSCKCCWTKVVMMTNLLKPFLYVTQLLLSYISWHSDVDCYVWCLCNQIAALARCRHIVQPSILNVNWSSIYTA